TLTILPKMRVVDLEQGIRDTFGLSIQVFRKSGNAWLETTTTVDWTLDEQNRIGEEMSKPEVENEGSKVF
ncbi:MAG TPA: hypothetical protein VK783_03020, partial [Bacteroidia bacterium]|nr:hypothetical protein [Bacteroidia bacterium]